MNIILGIDIGSSATKIVAMDESKTILNALKVSASDPVTAMYGAIGKILCEERLPAWGQVMWKEMSMAFLLQR